MGIAVLQLLGVVASAGLGALATFATLFNASERRLKRLERIAALRGEAGNAGKVARSTLDVAEALAAQEVLVDIEVSRRHRSRWIQVTIMLAASLMSLLGGGWLLKGQDNFGLFIVAAAFIYGYMLVALVLVERGRLEKARDSYRLELDEAVKDQEKVRAADSGGSPEGDVAVP